MTDAEVRDMMNTTANGTKGGPAGDMVRIAAFIPIVRSTLLAWAIIIIGLVVIEDGFGVNRSVLGSNIDLFEHIYLSLGVVFWIYLTIKDIKLFKQQRRIAREDRELEEYKSMKAQSEHEAELAAMRAWKAQQEGK